MAGQGRLAGKSALVTGASRGIGAAIALRLAQEGVAVAIGYKERGSAAEEVAGRIVAAGGRAVAFSADLEDAVQCEALVEKAQAELGSVDILVHNAGVAAHGLLMDMELGEWERLEHIHLRAAFLLAKASLPGMIRQRWGRLVYISSMWGLVGAANEVAYSAMKAGQIGLAKALSKEVTSAGVTVNAVAPGVIRTEMLDALEEEEVAELQEQIPAGRLGSPDDIAEAVAFLVSPASGYISGQVISPNGALVV